MFLARPSGTQNSNAANMSLKSNPGQSFRGRRELKYVQFYLRIHKFSMKNKEEIIPALIINAEQNIFAHVWKILLQRYEGQGADRQTSAAAAGALSGRFTYLPPWPPVAASGVMNGHPLRPVRSPWLAIEINYAKGTVK